MTFLELARLRRSVRRFTEQPVEPEKILELETLARRAKTIYEAAGTELLIISEPHQAEVLRKAIVSGWQGKINAWIYLTPIPAWIILCAKSDQDAAAESPAGNLPGAAMVLETVILAATEMDLGTCWMAGFNGNAVIRALSLSADQKPVICSPLGYPTAKGRMERVSRAVASSDRRKPLAEIHEIRGNLP